ncbi:MAG: phosphoglycerate kinase [Patescibacteria group bacterium]
MRSIRELKNIAGKTILVRVDFNLPIENGVVQDDFRIKKTLPTINFLKEMGAKIILLSHLGQGGESLRPVSLVLNKYLPSKFDDVSLENGEVSLLENLRNDPGEKNCDPAFAADLAKLGEIYVNEAFPVDHREDASIVLLPKLLPAYAGFQLEAEIENLSTTFKNPERPFLFILGGAKFSTKIPLIEKYLGLADQVFIGGALSNTLLAARGYEVGQSLVDKTIYDFKNILENKKLIIPEDVLVQAGNKLINRGVREVRSNETILDVGEETIKKLLPYIQNAKLILWNGPLGKYEVGGEKGTKKVLKAVAGSKAKSIIGGGDTVAIISVMKLENDFSFISTGGGAALEFLAKGILPGIKALS